MAQTPYNDGQLRAIGLVPVFTGEDGLPSAPLTAALASSAAAQGQSVLIVDCCAGEVFSHLGMTSSASLTDVLSDAASIADAKHITPDGDLTICAAGDAPLTDILGLLAVLSLSHDWVFVHAPAGCTPAHVRLAGAADQSIMLFHAAGDRFMRAYWMLDAIRSRAPKCDPLMVTCGPKAQAREAYGLFAGTVREFLGAPPQLGAIMEDERATQTLAAQILRHLETTISASIAA